MRGYLLTAAFLLSSLPVTASGGDDNSSAIESRTFHTPQMQISNDVKWYGFDIRPTSFDYYPEPTSRLMMRGNPYSADFSVSEVPATWGTGYITGTSGHLTLPGLMSAESGSFRLTQNAGAFTLNVGVSAYKYGSFRRLDTSYGIHGSLTWNINSNLSLTAFGNRYSNSVYISPATMPYIDQSSYGGYMSIKVNDDFSMDLGMQRTFNPWTGSEENVPITRFNYKFISIDAGYLLKELLEDLFFDRNKPGPSMGVPRPTIPIAPRR